MCDARYQRITIDLQVYSHVQRWDIASKLHSVRCRVSGHIFGVVLVVSAVSGWSNVILTAN